MKKILVVRYRFIGDTLLTIPFLRNLRRAYPDAQIDMIVGPVSGDVLLNCPYINNLIVFDTSRKHKYEKTGAKRKNFWSYVKSLKNSKYDKAYVLKRSLSSALLVFLAGIKERIGFDTEYRGFLLTKKVPYSKNNHEIECFLDVLRSDNIQIQDNHLENWVPDNLKNKIDDIFKEFNLSNHPKVLIHATSGNTRKQWPLDYFARVIEYLVNEKGVQIFYTGTESDSRIYDGIYTLISKQLEITPINLCGKLSLLESTALIDRMDFVVGCDSGNLHLAASLSVPVIGIYGPMNPNKWGAWGDIHTILSPDLPCAPCGLTKECTNKYACLSSITPETVINEANELLTKIYSIQK